MVIILLCVFFVLRDFVIDVFYNYEKVRVVFVFVLLSDLVLGEYWM